MKKRIWLALVLSVVCMCLLCGCAQGRSLGEEPIWAAGFCAELKGTRNGEAFGAKVTVGASDAGGLRHVEVEYLSPDALCGMRVTAVCLADGSLADGSLTGQAELWQNGLSASVEAISVAGLLRPATCFFSLGELSSVQKEGENYCKSFSGGVQITVDPSGVPVTFCEEGLSFSVVWFEKNRII